MTRIPGVPVTRAPLPFPLAIRSLETRPSCLPSNFEFFFSEKKKKRGKRNERTSLSFFIIFSLRFRENEKKKIIIFHGRSNIPDGLMVKNADRSNEKDSSPVGGRKEGRIVDPGRELVFDAY